MPVSVKQQQKKKYVPSIKAFMALCEYNYASLIRLLPQVEPLGFTNIFKVSEQSYYQIKVTECCKYTTTVTCSQVKKSLPDYLVPKMEVRLYHDANVAEVIKSQNIARVAPSYEYPNKQMHQKNEKYMINAFLKEWLNFSIAQGQTAKPVSW